MNTITVHLGPLGSTDIACSLHPGEAGQRYDLTSVLRCFGRTP
jgi:hypothetical protein